MKAEIKIFVRKSDHYKFIILNEQYNIKTEFIEANTEQEILDKFYKKNKRSDASYYNKFTSVDWNKKLNDWYKSDDYKKRSFSLYYENSIVD